jgi:hypothetical protein
LDPAPEAPGTPGPVPFHRFGYTTNPFRVLVEEEWAEVALVPAPVQALLAGGAYHLQVLGAAGRGKSTTLAALAARFRAQGQHVAAEYLPVGERRFRTPLDLPHTDVFCLDEAQRLCRSERRRLRQAARAHPGPRLVLGSHEDLARFFAEMGIALATVRLDGSQDESGAGHLRAIIERRLAYFALVGVPDHARLSLAPDAYAWLWDAFGSDRRGAERLLYEAFQCRAGEPITSGDGEPPPLVNGAFLTVVWADLKARWATAAAEARLLRPFRWFPQSHRPG